MNLDELGTFWCIYEGMLSESPRGAGFHGATAPILYLRRGLSVFIFSLWRSSPDNCSIPIRWFDIERAYKVFLFFLSCTLVHEISLSVSRFGSADGKMSLCTTTKTPLD